MSFDANEDCFQFFKKAQRQISVYFVDHIQLKKKNYSGK